MPQELINMACFGNYDVNNFECQGCRVINSCKRTTYDKIILRRRNEAERVINNKLKRRILSLLKSFNKPVTTHAVFRRARKWKGFRISYHRTKKLLLELKEKGIVKLSRKNCNGYYWRWSND